MEVMRGHTPDISMFRFRFWEPVWYFEPTAKYPKPNFLPGRFVGIAWEHGDAFTYKIWTTPGNDWEQGRDLVRNVVRSRHYDDSEPKVSYGDSDLTFAIRKESKKQQRAKKSANQTAATDAGVDIDDEVVVVPEEADRNQTVRFAPLPSNCTNAEEQGDLWQHTLMANKTKTHTLLRVVWIQQQFETLHQFLRQILLATRSVLFVRS